MSAAAGRGGHPPHVVTHGTVNEYANYGCRCQPCRDAWAAYLLGRMTPERRAAHNDRQSAYRAAMPPEELKAKRARWRSNEKANRERREAIVRGAPS
jgi:hypothetical protein